MNIKHIAAAVIILAACLWLVPGIPLVDADISANKLTVLHNEMGLKQTADHSVETYIEPLKYTFTDEDQEFQQILDILQHSHPAYSSGDFLQGLQLRAAHGAEHTPSQLEAGELGQLRQRSGVDRHIPAAADGFLRLSIDMAPLHQQRYRHTARVQGPHDDLGAFGNEQALPEVVAV